MSIRDLTPSNWNREPSKMVSTTHPIHALHKQMDRLWDDFFDGFDLAPFGRSAQDRAGLAPRIDVSERAKDYQFSAELPGVAEQDVEVNLADGMLTIKGEKKSENSEEKDHYLRTERRFGSFQRSFSLPSDIDEDKVKAIFKDGVLTVTVAKNKTAKSATKRIEVRAA